MNATVTIDLGGTRTKFGIVEGEQITRSSWIDADSQGSLTEHLTELKPHLQKMMAESGYKSFHGIGISSTGLVDSDNMRVLSTGDKYTDGKEFDFTSWGEQAFRLPVKVLNDAKAALLSEHHYGAAKGIENVLLVVIGTGIGTAAMVDGHLLKGHRHAGGNLGGHLIVNPNGRPCTCGGRGCMESESAGWVLPTLVSEHPDATSSPLSSMDKVGFKEVYEAAQANDPTGYDVWQHLLSTWGRGITSLIHAFSPEIVILGGGVMHLGEDILSPLRETIASHAWADFKHTPLATVTDPDNAALLGVASLF